MDRELGISDVVSTESGGTCALSISCRSAALKAELSHTAPVDPIPDRLDEMGVSLATGGNQQNGWRCRHERTQGQLEFMHDHLGSAYSASPRNVH
jgi:hypothetical protein